MQPTVFTIRALAPSEKGSWETMTSTPAYEEIGSAIRARHLETALAGAVCLQPETDEADAARVLQTNCYDQAPVVSEGLPIGFVLADELDERAEAPVSNKTHPLVPDHLVAAESSMADTLPWLARARLLFVLDGHEISGFVTPSDLNKQAGRTYFYVTLAELELSLSELIRVRFPDQHAAIALLGPNRRAKVLERYASERAENVDADLVACLTFADVCAISEHDDHIRKTLGFVSKTEVQEVIEPLKRLRDEVMHPVRALLTERRTVEELVVLARRLRGLIESAARATQ